MTSKEPSSGQSGDGESPISLLLSRLKRVRPSGVGWSAACPAHEDKNPSLSINLGDDGRILVHCHAKCALEAVMAAVDLPVSLLAGARSNAPPPPNTRKRNRGWSTLEAAANGMARQLRGAVEGTYPYQDLDGIARFAIARIRTGEGKTYRPFHFREARWYVGDPDGPLPLYRLPEVVSADRILVVEGEKCADVAKKFGIFATTSAHGAGSATNTDWAPAAAKEITAWPDANAAGRDYIQDVVDLVRAANPAAEIGFVAPEGLPEGGDIADWVAAREAEGLTHDDIAEALAVLLDGAAPWPEDDSRDSAVSAHSAEGDPRSGWPDPLPVVDHAPPPKFPVDDAFPGHLGWLRDFVVAVAECYQVPVDAVALLVLPVLALGLSRRFEVEPQPGWREQLSLYVLVLMLSGERKSALMRELLAPVYAWQHDQASGMADAIRDFENREKVAKSRLDNARKKAAKVDSESGELDELARILEAIEEERPQPPALVVTEGTSEAIARVLVQNNERALLAAAEGDALDIMLGRYSGSPNFGVWLSGHSGDAVDSIRRGREPDRLLHPALQVALCVQPEAVSSLLASRAAHGRGVLARFLYSAPESRVGFRELLTQPVPQQLRDKYGIVIQNLLNIEVPTEPTIVGFSAEAQGSFLAYREQNEIDLRPDGALALNRAWGSKLPGALARVAGIMQSLAPDAPTTIGVETLQSALALSDYLIAHCHHVTALGGDDLAIDLAQRIDRWYRRAGLARFSKRDAFNQVKSKAQRVEAIEPALVLLEDRHRIRQEPNNRPATRGRPPSPTFQVNPALLQNAGTPPHKSQSPHKPPSDDAASAQTDPEAGS